ncbi:MAG: M28 family peptidase, partial [Bryobacteraceae bacterium]
MTAGLVLCIALAQAPLVPDRVLRTLLDEISAENAYRHTRALASYPRYSNSQAFFDAAEYVAREARALGLENVRVERFEHPRPTWDAIDGELDLVEPEARRIVSLRDVPLSAAWRTTGGDVTAELVEADDDDHKGKIVLLPRKPDTRWKQKGAVGFISYASNEFFGRRLPPDSVSWVTAPDESFGMIVSPRQGEELARLVRQGKTVKVRMRVQTRRGDSGAIGQLMGELPGAIEGQDIVVVAHLDHPNPGANDNASGSAAILEALRALRRLVETGKLDPPRRTLRFWWSTEIVSEREYFRKHPEEAKKILLAVNLDQAGGDRHAANNLIAIYGPAWLPSWADDLIHNLAEHVKNKYAPAEHAPSPLLVAPGGGSAPMRVEYWPYEPLSDHLAFEARGVEIPAISLAVPSLGVIHSSADTVDRIDPTWLKRTTLLTLASAWFA